MLTLCGETFEPIWTDVGSGITWTPEWRRTVNPMGEIPVLVEDGVTMTQTAPILLHLAAKHGRFGGRDDAERFEILRWLFWDNQKLSGFMAAYRYLRAFVAHSSPDVLAYYRKRVDDFLTILAQRVAQSPFVVGNAPTIVDLSMCAYLSFPPNESGYDFALTHPAIRRWLDRIAQMLGWVAPYDLLPGQHLRCYV